MYPYPFNIFLFPDNYSNLKWPIVGRNHVFCFTELFLVFFVFDVSLPGIHFEKEAISLGQLLLFFCIWPLV